MREILFRAKTASTDNPEWVEGYYIFDGTHWIEYKSIEYPGFWESNPINPETLCEFTGLYDKKGVKVFEGDIVKCVSRTDEAKMVVIFEEGEFRMVIAERFNSYVTGAGYYAIRFFEKEVIGNIYDNPELLKEVENNGKIH